MTKQLSRSRQGFTLVEALVVIAMLGILARVVLTRVRTGTYQANAGARAVAATIAYAQRQAISQQSDIRVSFDVALRRLRVHEDRNNNNIMDADERVIYTSLLDGLAFGRGAAAARPIGGGTVTFTLTEGALPVVVFRRDGSASEEGGVYLTTANALLTGSTSEVRSVEISRATGRAAWYSYATGTWKRGI